MYYIIKTDHSEIIGLSNVNFYNVDTFDKEEYKFEDEQSKKTRFIIPTIDVEYIFGTENKDEWQTHLIKLEQGDDVVYCF